MMICENRAKSEILCFTFVLGCLFGGIGLGVASAVVPQWAHHKFIVGVVIMKADVGLMQTRICDYRGCVTSWFNEDAYSQYPGSSFPTQEVIRVLVLSGIISAVVALLLACCLWVGTRFNRCVKTSLLGLSSILCFASGSMCAAGSLMTAARIDSKHIGWAPILSGSGAGLLYIGGFLLFYRFRCMLTFALSSPRNQQQTEDVHEKQQPQQQHHKKGGALDKAVFIHYDYNDQTEEEKKQPL